MKKLAITLILLTMLCVSILAEGNTPGGGRACGGEGQPVCCGQAGEPACLVEPGETETVIIKTFKDFLNFLLG